MNRCKRRLRKEFTWNARPRREKSRLVRSPARGRRQARVRRRPPAKRRRRARRRPRVKRLERRRPRGKRRRAKRSHRARRPPRERRARAEENMARNLGAKFTAPCTRWKKERCVPGARVRKLRVESRPLQSDFRKREGAAVKCLQHRRGARERRADTKARPGGPSFVAGRKKRQRS